MNEPERLYSLRNLFTFVNIFNVIVGVGFLSLPQAFANAGAILGTIILMIAAFFSLVTATYVVEAMASANAITRTDNPSEDDYDIRERFEMGAIADKLFNGVTRRIWSVEMPVGTIGVIFCYIVICLYTYGDLSIYAVTIPKSLIVVVCAKFGSNDTDIIRFNENAICFGDMTQIQFYYIFLVGFALLVFPWTFCGRTNRLYILLQSVTAILRIIAFSLMIVITLYFKFVQSDKSHPSEVANFGELNSLFGVCIYAFLFQHSLPGSITPLTTKRQIFPILISNTVLVLFLYLLLAYTGFFLYPQKDQKEIYTLNFFTVPFSKSLSAGEQILSLLGYFLALFPVISLGSNFPTNSIVLSENIKFLATILFHRRDQDHTFHWAINRFVFPLIAVMPPLVIAFLTTNILLLVSITSAYFGIFVQYVIPVVLACAGRYRLKNYNLNKHMSLFSNPLCYLILFCWILLCIIMISLYIFY